PRALGPTTVARLYGERWQIEVFFRALKQNLRIKTFVGTSANALKIQIWTALIAMRVLKYLQLRASYGWSLSNLVALLRQQLFVYRDLFAWLNQPFEPPPVLEAARAVQLPLLAGVEAYIWTAPCQPSRQPAPEIAPPSHLSLSAATSQPPAPR